MKAFPLTFTNERGHSCGNYGMDLRDYFAAKAMQGFASTIGTVVEPDWHMMAREAYILADKMMEARDAK